MTGSFPWNQEDEMRLRDHDPAELAFYSKGTTDIEFLFPFGWGELWGIADRTDYDLGRIRKFQDRILHTSMTRRMRNICHTLSSHHSVQTV